MLKHILFFFASLFPIVIFSQSLIYNESFGISGKVCKNLSNDGRSYANAIAEQQDGKILICGQSVYRILDNGTADSSFGYAGVANIGAQYSIALQKNNKILVVSSSGKEVYCTRLNTDGSVDSSYANGKGVAKLPTIEDAEIYCRELLIQPDGKCLLLNNILSSGIRSIMIVRLLQDGAPDTTFADKGKSIIILGDSPNLASDMTLESSGNLMVIGTGGNIYESRLLAFRLLPNGKLDSTFNNNKGQFTYRYNGISAGASGHLVKILSNNKILLVGGSNGSTIVFRMLASGVIDSSFAINGLLTTETSLFGSENSAYEKPDGKILIVGVTAQINTVNSYDYSAFQITPTGEIDVLFGTNGRVVFGRPQNEHIAGSVLKKDGSIVIIGSSDSVNIINAVKFTPAGKIDYTFGNAGFKYINITGTDDDVEKILKQSDHKLIAVGRKHNDEIDSVNIVLARYTAKGMLDSSYGINGIAPFKLPDASLFNATLLKDDKVLISYSRVLIDLDNSIRTYFSGFFRVNANGSKDMAFAPGTGNAELVLSGVENTSDDNLATILNGKILFCGKSSSENRPVLIRLNDNGTVDNTFGSNGRVIFSQFEEDDVAGNLFSQKDGKIILSFQKDYDDFGNISFVRLLQNGDFDSSFGINGRIDNFSGKLNAYKRLFFTIDSADRYIISGFLLNNPDEESNHADTLTVYRLLNNGKTDSSFNQIGFNRLDMSQLRSFTEIDMTGICVLKDNSVNIAGHAYSYDNDQYKYRVLITSFKSNGFKDSTLTIDRNTVFFVDRSVFEESSMVATSDSTFIIGGKVLSGKGDYDFALLALKKLKAQLYTFNGNGKWSDPANWSFNTLPPAILPPGSIITISTQAGQSCMLDITQRVSKGASLIVTTGSTLITTGTLIIE